MKTIFYDLPKSDFYIITTDFLIFNQENQVLKENWKKRNLSMFFY